MTSQELGSNFEIITKDFFVWILEKIGFTVVKERIQFSGTQNGFDILIIVSKNYTEHKISIECKNYSSDLDIGNILKKAWDLEKNYKLDSNDLFIAINPRSNFKNEDNSEKASPILDEKFEFRSYFLDVSNGVKKLFALNNSFYRQLYASDVDYPVDEAAEIERFKSIIYSRKPFKKIIIDSKDKSNFIGNIELVSGNIERHYSKKGEDEISSILIEKHKRLNLTTIVKNNDKIFILGNPGIGKSTELKTLAINNWKEGETEDFVPIFKSLRNFTITDDITNYLPEKWNELRNVLLIFDGIDEITDIEYFKSKFENFIEKNSNNKKKIKYIISCRTNIYESIVKGITDFNVFFLKDLTYEEGTLLLKNKCGSIIDKLNYTSMHLAFLNNPFQIEVLSEYIIKYNFLPKNTAELWETYIEKRLTHDKIEKLKKITLNLSLIKYYSKKLSLISELRKTNICSEDKIYTIVNQKNDDFNEFKKNPLLTKQMNEDVWYFEHKNIQEYFAANVIASLSIDEIKKFILIPTTSKIHPSLFNTITFLINLIDTAKYTQLVEWFIINEPEILLKSDSNRITSDIRIKVFQKYFKSECIDKTFWIGTNKTFTEREIATFGDCEENYIFLTNIIKENTFHFRAIISALRLLKYFKLTTNNKSSLKNDFIILLKDNKVDMRIKCSIIEVIEHMKFCMKDALYQETIFEIFKSETNKELNRRLLGLLSHYENVDEYFSYIKDEFLRENEIVAREVYDEVRRGNNWILESLILKLKNADNFIFIIHYYFKNQHNLDLSSDFSKNLKITLLDFIKLDPDIIIKLFQFIDNKTSYFKQEKLLKDIIRESKTQSLVIKYLLDNNSFSETHFFIAHLITTEELKLIIDKYNQQTDESIPQNIEYFRNIIANTNSRIIASEFNELMIKNGFKFREKFLTDEEIEKTQTELKNKPQTNFDKLFNIDELKKEIEGLFTANEGVLNRKKIEEIENNWYAKNGYWNTLADISILFIRNIIYRRKIGDLSYVDFLKILDDNFTIYDEIKNTINRDKNQSIKITINKLQKQKIQEWCNNAIRSINFENMIKKETINSFKIFQDYKIFNNILFFQKEFDFQLPKEFLLNSIQFYGIENNDDDAGFDNLLKKINDKELSKEKIILNIKSKNLLSIPLKKHIEYAIDNNLNEIFDTIRDYFIDSENNYLNDDTFEKYITLTKDYNLLKELSSDMNNHICWTSIRILTKNNKESEFCIQKSITYLNQSNSKLFYSNALGILFHYNHPKAIEYFYSLINEDITSYYNGTEFANYTIPNYELLEKIFMAIYVDEEDKFKFGNHFTFFNIYIANLSKNDVDYQKTQEVLHKLKKDLEARGSDSGIFYINQQIDNSKNIYINSKSKPLSFEDALKKVEEIIK